MREKIGTYLEAEDLPVRPGCVTCRWGIYAVRRGWLLGEVVWYGPWRQYCFKPRATTVFNAGCLWDIAKFCDLGNQIGRYERLVKCPVCLICGIDEASNVARVPRTKGQPPRRCVGL